MKQRLVFFLIAPVLIAILYGFIFAGFNIGRGLWLLPLSMLIGFIFLALFIIQVMLVPNLMDAAVIILLETACLMGPILLTGNFGYLSFVALASILFFLLWAHYAGRREVTNMINLKFFKLRKVILGKAVVGMTLFSVLVYVGFLDLATLTVTKSFIQSIAQPIEYTARFFVPNFSMNMTTGEFLRALVYRARPEIKNLPPAQQSEFVFEASQALVERLADITKVNINLQRVLSDSAYDVVNFQLRRIPPERRTPVLISVGAVLFLFITGFALIFSWLIGLIGWLIYQLLLATNFIRISYQTKPVESVIID